MATPNSGPVESEDQDYRSEMEKAYDKGFAEIEYRAFRAMHMNYEESTYFDDLSRRTEAYSYLTGGTVLACGLLMMWRDKRGAVYLAISALPATGVVQYAAVGQYKGLPSFYLRAQNHVDAGARWMKLHRQAAMYREELSKLPPGAINLDELRERYKKLLDLYQEASLCTVIRKEAYTKFKQFKLIKKEYLKRLVNYFKYENLHKKTKEANEENYEELEKELEALEQEK